MGQQSVPDNLQREEVLTMYFKAEQIPDCSLQASATIENHGAENTNINFPYSKNVPADSTADVLQPVSEQFQLRNLQAENQCRLESWNAGNGSTGDPPVREKCNIQQDILRNQIPDSSSVNRSVVPPQSWGDRSDTKHSKCLLLGGRRLNQLTLIPKPKGSGGARAATAQVGPANKRNDTKRCLPVEASLRPGEAVPW